MKHFVVFAMVVLTLIFGTYILSGSAQQQTGTFHGRPIIIPESSIPHAGQINTNYFIVGSREGTPQPPPDAETPGSVACVYQLVSGPPGCPIATSTNVPTGGVGAIVLVDGGDYPTAVSDLHAFSAQFGLPDADLTVVYADGTKPPVYQDWIVEEALDIEWAHAMAPKAKLFLVEALQQANTDPTWQAVQVAGQLVNQNGGGMVSMSWGTTEWPGEIESDPLFTAHNTIYFGATGDFGLNVSYYPAASPNVVAVGGTSFNRDQNGNFLNEQYSKHMNTGGGGGTISPYEARPSYQNVISNLVGNFRGYPDVASDYCCAAIYLQGAWVETGGTSWSTPTFAGIVSSAGHLGRTTRQALTFVYNEYATGRAYKGPFYDITTGDPNCHTGWDICAGIGSPRTYAGK